MVELIPEYVDNAIVFMAYNKIPHCETKCKLCVDFSVGIHNWILANEVSYIIIDLQDEKTICQVFLEELINLRKRLKIPFYFAGVMARPKQFLDDFGMSHTVKYFMTPEQAADDLKSKHPELYHTVVDKNINLVHKITVSRARLQQRFGNLDTDVPITEVNL